MHKQFRSDRSTRRHPRRYQAMQANGRKGGKARAEAMTPEQRREITKQAAEASLEVGVTRNMSMSRTTAGVILAVFSLMLLGGCDEGPGTTERLTAETPEPDPEPDPEPPETPKQACMPHPSSQIVGDWDASGVHAQDDEVYSFHSDGTYQEHLEQHRARSGPRPTHRHPHRDGQW